MIVTFWLRPDTVFLLVFVSIYVALIAPVDSRVFGIKVLVGILAALAVSTFMIQSISGYKGVRHHLSISGYSSQKSIVAGLSVYEYIGISRVNLARGLRNLNALFVFLIVSILGFFMPFNAAPRVVLYRHLMAVAALTLLVKVIVFPILEIRLYVSIYCLICIAFSANLWHAISNRTASVIVEKQHQ